MNPKDLFLLALYGAGCAIVGYAFRGSIRKDIALAVSEVGQLAQRLENAVRTDAATLKAEAVKIIDELRAKL